MSPLRPFAAASGDDDGPPAIDRISEAGATTRPEMHSLPPQPRAAAPIGRDRLETPPSASPLVASSADAGLLPVARDRWRGLAVATSATGPAAMRTPVARVMATPRANSIGPASVEPTRSRQLTTQDRASEVQRRSPRSSEAGPDVVISIGRIEVRAPATPLPHKRDTTPDTSRLDGYLEARSGRAHR